jgi:uncharacterized protein (DUF1501 family)
MPTRRSLLTAGASLTLLAPFARFAHAVPNPDARLVLVILRGGLDGLAAVPPYAEPQYAALRGPLALSRPGTDGGALDLDGTFGLHPSLTHLHALYRSSEALVLHAAATPYRERSHFDAQKVLEAGGESAASAASGWLNRALGALDAAGDAPPAIALADSIPLVLRGDLAVTSWAPSRLPESDADTLARQGRRPWVRGGRWERFWRAAAVTPGIEGWAARNGAARATRATSRAAAAAGRIWARRMEGSL